MARASRKLVGLSLFSELWLIVNMLSLTSKITRSRSTPADPQHHRAVLLHQRPEGRVVTAGNEDLQQLSVGRVVSVCADGSPTQLAQHTSSVQLSPRSTPDFS